MILCVGPTPTVQRSMFFDRLVPDAVNRAAEVYEYASGKSVNVARVARALGGAVLCTGFLGGDRGGFVRRELDREGIGHDFVTVPARTRLCTTVVDRAGGTVTELVEESAAVPEGAWAELDAKIAAVAPAAGFWALSGSLPPGGPPDFYARCVERAAAGGRVVVVDARGESMRLALRHPGFIAKMNREELAATVGGPVEDGPSLRAAVAEITPRGGAAVVTLGADGAVATDGRRAWKLTPPRVDAVSPVGSGDAFTAGLVVGLMRGRPFVEACALGVACGAANATTARAGEVDAGEVERLFARVIVREYEGCGDEPGDGSGVA